VEVPAVVDEPGVVDVRVVVEVPVLVEVPVVVELLVVLTGVPPEPWVVVLVLAVGVVLVGVTTGVGAR
jgi:hypothetical protein